MKDSLKSFYKYLGSDEELMYYIRIKVEWNEKLFIKMQQLVRAVIKDYADEDFYPKKFVIYFMSNIPCIINVLSQFKKCTEKELLAAAYTDATYQNMLSERIEQLEKLRKEFIFSLSNDSSTFSVGDSTGEKT